MNAPRNPVRFPGIVRHARQMKVSRMHLYLVLTGQRTSHRLLRRYRALIPFPRIPRGQHEAQNP
jgi:hypothetical protein